jgi:thioredoxin reductase-like selenoprotein T
LQQVAQFLSEKFPEIEISGDVYPPSPISVFLLQLLSIIQLLGIAWMVFGGDVILRSTILRANQPLPRWYYTVQENGAPLVIFLFLLAPNIIQNLASGKGAFEIYLNDTLVFSKLKTGAMPTVDDLTRPLIQAGLAMLKDK